MAEKEMAPRTEANDAEPRDQTNPLYQSALDLAERGLPVFPLADRSKKTRKGSGGFKDATCDAEQIRAWWTENPNANVGIATEFDKDAGCGLLVVDIDVGHGSGDVDGSVTLREFEAKHGDLTPTVTVNTPNNGTHYYYKVTEPMSNVYRCAELGVDIRCKGHVVAPPSVLETGQYVYETSFDDIEIAPVDDSVRAFIDYVRGDSDSNDSNDSSDKTNDAQQDSGLPDTIPEGKRNTTITSLAGKLQYYGLPDGLLRDCVHAVNQTRCEPPLKSDEVDNTVNKAITYEKGKPRGTNADASDNKPLKVLHYDPEVVKNKAPEVIDGILRAGTVGLLSGRSKAGKTVLMSELAFAVATGGKWLGFHCAQGDVLVVDGEMLMSDLWQRYEDIAAHYAKDVIEVMQHIDFIEMMGEFESMDTLAYKIIDAAKERNYTMIIVDPAYKFIGEGDENNAGDVTKITNLIWHIAQITHAAVMFTHHHSKGAKGDVDPIDRMSGSGVWARSPYTVMDLIELEPTKEQAQAVKDHDPAFCVSSTVRGFSPVNDFNIWYKYPIHVRDYMGDLAGWRPMNASRFGAKSTNAIGSKAKETRKTEFSKLLDEAIAESNEGRITMSDAIEIASVKVGVTDGKTIRTYINELDGFQTVTIGANKSYVERRK